MERTITIQYSIDDQILNIDYSDPETPDVAYSYDPYFSRVVSRSDGVGTNSFTYYPVDGASLGAGQLKGVDGPFSDDTLIRTYDELGRTKWLRIVDDATTTTATWSEEYLFDSRGRVERVSNDLGDFDYTYLGQSSRIDRLDYPNGVQTIYDYFDGPTDWLLKEIKNLSGGSPAGLVSSFQYSYNPDRTIAGLSLRQGNTSTSTWVFTYNQDRELTGAQRVDSTGGIQEDHRFVYDDALNRNFAYDPVNQLRAERGFGSTLVAGQVSEPATVTVNGRQAELFSTNGSPPYHFEVSVNLDEGANEVSVVATDGSDNSTTRTFQVTGTSTTTLFEYDSSGNLRYEREPSSSVRREFEWDQANRLKRVITGGRESVFEYDGESLRVGIRDLVDGVETSNHAFIWCGSRICQKRSGSTVLRRYFMTGFMDSQNRYFYTRDHVGSVHEVIASDGVTVASRVRYGPWGQMEVVGGSGDESDFGYTGHYFRRDDDLLLATYRTYSPDLARWLSRDPLGEVAGTNLFAYVENDPIVGTDSTGLLTDSYTNCVRHLGPEACGGLPAPRRPPNIIPLLCAIFPSLCDPGDQTPGDGDEKCKDPKGDEKEKEKKQCGPCGDDPLAPRLPPSRIDRVPPSRPHHPCPGDHKHVYYYNQNPHTCQCFVAERVVCL
jgi:RHS repeat-associated protein